MRFIVMHKVDAAMEAGAPPNQDIVSNMGALVQGSLREGVFLNGAGLHRSARRVKVQAATGGAEPHAKPGPYQGENELVASFVMISARSLDAAVGHAETLASSLGGAEVEVGPVVEPWDLGMMTKPNAAPERFLLLCKSTAADEAGDTGAHHAAAARALSERLGDDGAVLAAESLAPSAKGSRLASAPKGQRLWVDGPFAESKELIAGFSLLQLPSKAEALAWADRYAAILGENEVDVRELNEP
ncbi:MAG: hypothetical protein K0R38_1608 [Polyangiaceae bacterium]|jgi:hypothetical protein|nr:hypothetical protein [Polyangiaceae bacterium]